MPKIDKTFSLNGVKASEFGIILTSAPEDVYAERDVTEISIPGRSGDLIIDNGRYKNKKIPYECCLIPVTEKTLRESVDDAMGYFRQFSGYVRVEDDFHPDVFRMATTELPVNLESLMEKAGVFSLQLNFKPQRYLKSGESAFEFTEASFLINPTRFPAKPLITVYGIGPGELTVGTVTVKILALEDQVVLDCDTQNAYRQPGEGGIENKNSTIFAPEFPELSPGANTITWTGDITSVHIIPRWWTL